MNPLENLKKYKIKLASGSPRRRELLAMLDIDFQLVSGIDVDESFPADIPAHHVPQFIATKKAAAYLPTIGPDEIIITADTGVIVDDKVLGKPADRQEAIDMLQLISGRSHLVITGVVVATHLKREVFSNVTRVEFDRLQLDEIEYYVDTFKPFDKAGAYGIQEWIGAVAVKGIDGCYYNVMGLPVNHLYQTLRHF
ncbi:MAG: septum formation protein Maf [Muribaculaceae bacterium]|nr:septum formation protein Maf [Muribaculaceae bacterium]